MKLKHAFAIAAATLVLASPFAVQAQQSDQMLDGQFNKQMYMKMANKDGMMAKADVMKMVSDKFDAMAKSGMISVDNLGVMLRDLYRGGSR
jgi:hypothetical protein